MFERVGDSFFSKLTELNCLLGTGKLVFSDEVMVDGVQCQFQTV